MSEQRIGQGSTVTLHFSLKFDNGEVVDSNFEKDPATFTIGDGSLLPGFERVLFGLKDADKRTFEILPEQGFGTPNEQNVQVMPRSQFDSMELDYGVLVIFKDAAGGEMPGVVKAFNDQQVTIDFNHPLAGKVITFDVEIIQVQNSTV
ncbi:MAG: FKBP-type peptidyl-prolyl cis-trans isomerase [Thiopseudomonas sp.]|jgi:FKBP-type peptidyl-prolyl cis-trans isomerase SlpA|uniref:FKBP-type peptidyl-prolyl cis-trans isomerase n=1 Tax=Denitrificimonas caeni TaxID=521720 RepID=UPI0003B5FFC7|nr:FKBP-type peptidyl-prolyl cis-trans isomerase [Denitrificimonas caeni]MBP8008249.1 FKBP-type peptidyl-prolyl cis-trans isomerase [Thiopseudomonas sp.]MBP8770567.1 FKBP-type peptidyl-prolyl cis-trans isomerase [Thiopseudomonas sp.]HAB92748.1 FKBP-type peptidyl-prolyl cis-trans isomerase [Pseudomonas sp.]HHX05511.1 FKBP-type peptidyl-prolyl cis-trans isomerase [Pseudomonas sp.]